MLPIPYGCSRGAQGRLVRLQAEQEDRARLHLPPAQGGAPLAAQCLGMNPDQLKPGERAASTSNRSFEGRQGKGGRTHLVSPHGRRPGGHRQAQLCHQTCKERAVEEFTSHTGTAVPLRRSNVLPTRSFPAVYTKRVARDGVWDGCSHGDPIRTSYSAAAIRGSSSLDPRPRLGTGSSRSTPSGP